MKRYILTGLLILGALYPVQDLDAGRRAKAMTKAELRRLAKAVALRHGLNPRLYLAMLQVESRFKVDAYNPKTRDYGIAQVHGPTAKAFGFNTRRMLISPAYGMDCGAKVMADMQKRHAKAEPKTWACRYNVGTRPLVGARLKACNLYLAKLKAAGAPL